MEITPSDVDMGAFNLEIAPTIEPHNIDPNVGIPHQDLK
jgi:hypothetical protein